MKRQGPYDETPRPDPWTFWMFGLPYAANVQVFIVGDVTVEQVEMVIKELSDVRRVMLCPDAQKNSPVNLDAPFLL